MKSMLIATALVGAAIAGIIIYSRSEPGNLKAKQLRDKAASMLSNGNGHAERSSVQTMG